MLPPAFCLAALAVTLALEPCPCTGSFAMVTLAVTDAAGRPITDADVKAVSRRSHQPLSSGLDAPSRDFLASRGHYLLADDGMRNHLTPANDTLDITVTREGRRATARVVIGLDQPCKCHVARLAGPDTVILR